jgi:ABC-type lipoprotein export system ATPase subunit
MSSKERESALTQILAKVRVSDVSAFGIMDYWTFDGYLALCEYVARHGEALVGKAIFPGIELRIESPADFRLNVHVLLSDQVRQQALDDFRAALKLRIGGKNRSLSREALVDLARELDLSKVRLHGFSEESLKNDEKAFELGAMTAEVTRESFVEACRQWRGESLVILPFDTSDGLAGVDWKKHGHSVNELLRMAHIFETRRQENVDLFLGIKTPQNSDFIDDFMHAMGGAAKPAISGSDAHRLQDYGNFPGGKCTWLKADVTWSGLTSVICEPTERSFVGEKPAQMDRVASRRTKYITSLHVKKREGSELDEIWFDNDVPLSSGMIAIIGNKGSGKSALADILGLLGNSSRERWFPFLNEKQFCQPSGSKAEHFEARLVWESGQSDGKKLSDGIKRMDPETVCYIPQNCFEEICNELERPGPSGFDAELKSVIFSHVPRPDRLGQVTLDGLIRFRTGEIEQSLAQLRLKLARINEGMIDLEGQATEEHRDAIQVVLDQKRAELVALDVTKPPLVNRPATKSKRAMNAANELTGLKRERARLQRAIKSAQDRQGEIALLASRLEQARQGIERFEREFAEFMREFEGDLKSAGLKTGEIAKLFVDTKPIKAKRAELVERRKDYDAQLDPGNNKALVSQLAKLDERLKHLQSKLDEPNQRYQKYQQELNEWKSRRREVTGTKTMPETLRYFEHKLKELNSVPGLLQARSRERLRLVKDIHTEISRLATIYSELFKPVQEFIREHPLAKDKVRLVFDVSVIDVELESRFFDWVHQGVTGSFYGSDEGRELLQAIVKKHDFAAWQQTQEFLGELMNHLTKDARTGKPVEVTSQLRKDRSLQSLYDYVFSLSYLKPRYVLKMGDKQLHELSPGEKGALLLIFYLLVDRSDIPLVIDQPEANLDNETVFDLLVPAIKEAKQRRQIIVVTHNPNIAVVCDADQVMCASLDKTAGYRIEYTTGAIENPVISKRIVEVLEGTMPAFDNRDSKYSLVAGLRKRLFTG